MRLKELLQASFVQALALNILFLLLCLGIGGIHVGSLDDYFMSAMITGAYGGEFDPHILFVNGAYAYFLHPFYLVFPTIGWYYIFQMLSVLMSFIVFTYFILRQIGGKLGLSISIFLLASLAPDSYLQIAFTQCAAAATAAAMVLFYFGNNENRRMWLITGGVFFIVGIIFRREGFLLGVPFFATTLAISILETRKIQKTTIAILLLCIGSYFGLQSFNNKLFEGNEYNYYRESQWNRAVFGDGDNFDLDATYDELEERQMFGRDFWYMRKWIFYDTEALSLDSLRPFENVVWHNRYEINYIKMPAALFFTLANSFFKTNAWCWSILCFIFFYFIPKRANWYVWGSLSLICICLGYLLLVNRVVYHVESGIWLYAITSAIPIMKPKFFTNANKNLSYLIGIMALGTLLLAFSAQWKINNDKLFFGVPQMPESWTNFVNHANSHPNDIFLLYFFDYKDLATFKNPAYSAVKPRSWANIIPLGYWNINSNGMKRELAEHGVTNPIRDIIKDNVYVLENGTKYMFNTYYQDHYRKKIVRDTITYFGDMQLIKYRLDGGEL